MLHRGAPRNATSRTEDKVKLATLRNRIIDLKVEGVIDQTKYNQMIQIERRLRGGLGLVETKLGEHFAEFKARAYTVAKCRGREHMWDWSYDHQLSYRPIGSVYTESARCLNCTTVKVVIINALGQADRTVYYHPDGYSLSGVRTTKRDWKELVRYMELMMEVEELEQQEQSAPTAPVVPIGKRRSA